MNLIKWGKKFTIVALVLGKHFKPLFPFNRGKENYKGIIRHSLPVF